MTLFIFHTASRLPPIAYSQHTSQNNPSERVNILIETDSLLSSKPYKYPYFTWSQSPVIYNGL